MVNNKKYTLSHNSFIPAEQSGSQTSGHIWSGACYQGDDVFRPVRFLVGWLVCEHDHQNMPLFSQKIVKMLPRDLDQHRKFMGLWVFPPRPISNPSTKSHGPTGSSIILLVVLSSKFCFEDRESTQSSSKCVFYAVVAVSSLKHIEPWMKCAARFKVSFLSDIIKGAGLTWILRSVLRLLQTELFRYTEPNPGTHTYAIVTTKSQRTHIIFSLERKTQTWEREREREGLLWAEQLSCTIQEVLSRNPVEGSWRRTLPARSLPLVLSHNLNITRIFSRCLLSTHLPPFLLQRDMFQHYLLISNCGFEAACHDWITAVSSNINYRHSPFRQNHM